MNSAVGFTAIWHGTEEEHARAVTAQQRALAHFPDLELESIRLGETIIYLWGRGDILDTAHYLPDGSLLALIGSPVGDWSWEEVEREMSRAAQPDDFRLPWDGRIILLHISANGKKWIMWNDWLGSIPVYRSESTQNHVISTLEPVVVSVRQFTPEDFFLPGIVALLAIGNLFSDWTIYKQIKVSPPDAVAQWDEKGFHWRACSTIQPTDDHWESGWDDLVDEMHHLSKKAIVRILKTQRSWTLPLSSGLDSRLIAAIGKETGADLMTYTWGPATTRDVLFSRQIAKVLKMPWKRVDLGEKYIAQHVKLWSDLFGSSMPFRGIYQIPFLMALRSEPPAKILSGFLGDSLAGYDVKFQSLFHKPDLKSYYIHPINYCYWEIEQIKELFKISVDDAIEQVSDEISMQRDLLQGPWFQKIRFLTLWGRQRYFTYFQSFISDYWFGVEVPYLNRDYARFCLSLPRAVLDDRRLQIDMMRRYYPKVMSVPGTYAAEPAVVSGSFLLKRKLANSLPKRMANFVLPEFSASKNIQSDIANFRLCGENAIWPIPESGQVLDAWVNMEYVDRVYQEAVGGDKKSVRKLQALQTIAFRMMD